MIPQPYPLFYGRLDGDDRETGRIVGWREPAGGSRGGELSPLVLFHNPNGTTGRIQQVELTGGAPCWVRDSEDDLTAAFELHDKLNRIKDLTQ